MRWAMTRVRELLGISFPLMSPAVVACSVEGIKAASRVFSRGGPSRLGGCAACRVTPRNQAAAAATNCCPPELLGQSKALTLNP